MRPDARRPTADRTSSEAARRCAGFAITGVVGPGDACPCGSRLDLAECCLRLANALRDGTPDRLRAGAPFDELRASAAMLLWSLVSHRTIAPRVRQDLSAAARRFWGTTLASEGQPLPIAPSRPWSAATRAYAEALFERLWKGVDPATGTWLLGAAPRRLRRDPVLAELGLDWLLWDAPWLRGRPAGAWILGSSFLGHRQRARDTMKEILRSRPGLHGLRAAAGDAFELHERFGGRTMFIRTPSPPWEDPGASLLVRTYRFGSWRLAGGDGFLLPADETQRFVADTLELNRCHGAAAWPDPRWRGWLKAWLVPLVARYWAGRDHTGSDDTTPA